MYFYMSILYEEEEAEEEETAQDPEENAPAGLI